MHINITRHHCLAEQLRRNRCRTRRVHLRLSGQLFSLRFDRRLWPAHARTPNAVRAINYRLRVWRAMNGKRRRKPRKV
jgi:hypothetical protein